MVTICSTAMPESQGGFVLQYNGNGIYIVVWQEDGGVTKIVVKDAKYEGRPGGEKFQK